MKKLIIAGGSGFLGNLLINHFQSKFDTLYVLSRDEKAPVGNIIYLLWDGKKLGQWQEKFEDADVVINLAGKSVDCRYTKENKDLILSSRVESTNVIGQAIRNCTKPPKVWINSSTATIYRHSLDQEMSEIDGTIGSGFSVDVAKKWEQAFFKFSLSNTRQVALRTSIVLGKNGGAFPPIKRLAQFGLGGKQGDGNQKVSWIHEEDFNGAVDFIINATSSDGVINIVAPTPTSNRILMKTLRRQMGVPFGIPMGKTILKFGAMLIKTETELILKSRNVIPKRLIELGFQFQHPQLEKAIDHLIK